MRTIDGREITAPEVTLRIPGCWSGPEEFLKRLPSGCRFSEDRFTLSDGTEFDLTALEADDKFPGVFASSCLKLPTEEERRQIENYRLNLCLTGRCGSIEAARQLMAAGAAILAAGGAGVFVDNSAVAHGATDWLALHDGADNGGVYWAFVGTARSEDKLYSVGMQILGFRDAIVPRTGNEDYDYRALHSFLGYAAFSGESIHDGDVVGDAVLPTFRAQQQPHDRFPKGAPMFNPYGQWRLVPLDAQQN